MTFIYKLIDPRIDKNKIYIGKSDNPEKRYKQHINDKKELYKQYWINKLKSMGLLPKIEIIEECSEENWQEREIYWIKYYRDLGYDLTNSTNGGEGGNLLINSVSKIKHSINTGLAHKGKIVSDEQKIKQREKMLGKKHSQEHNNKIRTSMLGDKNHFYGKHHTTDTKELLKKINLGKKLSNETKEKLSILGRRKRRRKSSDYYGVSKYSKTNQWRARIFINGKEKHLGLFNNEIDAAISYNNYVINNHLDVFLNQLEV